MPPMLRESFLLAVSAMREVAVRARDGVADFVDRDRKARLEAELDRKQEELRRTILQLADALGMEAHEARKLLIRESYLASGRAPNASEDS